MAHFNFNKDIQETLKFDGPITNGPPMRWQRKAPSETLLRIHSTDGGVSSPLRKQNKTPGKMGDKTLNKSSHKTPGKSVPTTTPGKNGKTSKTPSGKTPGRSQQDRFIPNRSSTNIEYAHYAVMKAEADEDERADNLCSGNVEYQELLKDAFDMKDKKILCFNDKAPKPQASVNNLQVLYSQQKASGRESTTRNIPKQPERVLDAPELMDDYYLNLLDWSKFNTFAVALGNAVFLWNADNGNITQLMELASPSEYFSSLSWLPEGAVLGVGVSTGVVQLWDVDQQKLIRSMSGHSARVGSLSWNNHILSSGSRSGAIHHHDVRVANHQVASLQHHTQEVCGLKWSPDGSYMASGGNDNLVNVWPNEMSSGSPLSSFTDHQAAVKALAWCPWQPNVLASGGGTADRHIRFWNVRLGCRMSATDTESQVCAILWSNEYKELVSGHGYAKNHLRIWKYPTMAKVGDLIGHSSRILSMAMSPDGTMVASAAADETIRLWKCFPSKVSSKSSKAKEEKKITSDLQRMCIR